MGNCDRTLEEPENCLWGGKTDLGGGARRTLGAATAPPPTGSNGAPAGRLWVWGQTTTTTRPITATHRPIQLFVSKYHYFLAPR